MLVLTRKRNEKITITVPPSNEPTVITISLPRIQPGSCRVGIEAVRDVIVRRAELPPLSEAQIQQQAAKRAQQ